MGLEFKQLELSDKARICDYVRQYPPYSDFNFTNLWVWYNVNDSTRYGFLNGNLVIEFVGMNQEYHFYSFLGNNRVIETVDTLFDVSVQNGIQPVLELVPEVSLAIEDEELGRRFDIQEDNDMFDYVYALQDIIELEGPGNASKRRGYRKFLRDYGMYDASELDLKEQTTRNQIVSLLDIWYQQKGASAVDAGHEHAAINKLLAHAGNFDLSTTGVYYEGQLIGLYISEIVDRENVIGHFKKGDYRYAGIFQILEIENAKHLLKSGRKYLNEQQDLGLKGLRRSKLGRNPIQFLKKYTVATRF